MEEIIIPSFSGGKWDYEGFKNKEDLKNFVKPLFREPGYYNFNEISLLFNEQARNFNRDGFYSETPKNTKDYLKYWDDQKSKCRKGVIFRDDRETWYIPRDYYMWLNFLPIFDKEEQKFGFAKVRDGQYHMALYETLAELHYKHCSILKKRQFASSYYHAGKLINQLWFEEGVTLKIGANLKDYINEKGTWRFFNEYAAFLNEHTAWYRPMNPNKVLMWQQKIEVRKNNKKAEVGLKGTLQGMSFEKDATTGVGGPVKYFFHEEAGIAPKMDQTYGYMRPALKAGMVTTGMFIAAGSVGDLDQCDPLKELTLFPDRNDIYSVETNLIDDKGTIGRSGLFIPEQWSMLPYIDQYGNSQVEQALEALNEQFAKWKKELPPDQYQLRVSQNPRNIKEAFDYRTVSIFPQHLIQAQEIRIDNKDYPFEFVDLYKNEKGEIVAKGTDKLPISEFPFPKSSENKEGSIVVWERPLKDPEWGLYYASVDPVAVGKTSTSESLCSIYIYKNSVEVTTKTPDGFTSHVEEGKIVAAWCGRFDDINKTHERLLHLIEWYNAWTIVENNVYSFIQYMIEHKKQKYLVPKDQMVFLKDLASGANGYQEYGWRNMGRLFKDNLLGYAVEYLREELAVEEFNDGKIKKITYGVERIPDKMLLAEMKNYQEDLNVDRLVSFAALIAFVKIQQANKGYKKRHVENDNDKLQNSKKFSKLEVLPFNHIGRSTSHRSLFKNLR
jgi:hypothetical protein